MRKQVHSLLFALTLTLFLGVGVSLNAQQPGQTPQAQPPQTQDTPRPGQAQEPAQQSQAQPGQTPDTSGVPVDSKAQPTAGAGKIFTGTIMKSGDKYVLQDASGMTYDLDNQEAAKKFDGKKVKIQGTLDANGKTIHIQ